MVLWCNWLSLWTLNPTIRVQIPAEPYFICIYISHRSSVGRAGDCNELSIDIPRSLVRIRPVRMHILLYTHIYTSVKKIYLYTTNKFVL